MTTRPVDTTTRIRTTRDSLTMLRRSLRHTLRSPDSMIVAVALPFLLMLLFVYVFGGAIDTGTEYLDYVVPGILVLCSAWGASTTAVSVCSDMVEGIVTRFRTLAIAQSAVLTGHVLASLVRNLATTALVTVLAVVMGFRPSASVLGWLAAIAVIAGFVTALSFLCAGLGMLAKTPEAASGFTFGFLFLPYVSSAFVPTETMPTWMHGFAEYQPMTPIIETLRALLSDAPVGSAGWTAAAWIVGIGCVGFGFATSAYRRRADSRA
ncbi:ABC transporter permease [Rhodococcus sp. NPDC058521]|uniref:ABC transporter permease n=1 Tax=Rhodococcus sp. NPDC058521 TaxID=3346536 RepID=UPI00364A1916